MFPPRAPFFLVTGSDPFGHASDACYFRLRHGSCAGKAGTLGYVRTQSPFLRIGTASPSAVMPSISSSFEPIMKSVWMDE
jgi:hypothetical protein